ncbi:SDR family NAD(P)-dependent oxidoreductase [Planctomonas sp. JC2975]|nr:SDR family NAD(P)-dependent oxidoreductase [Planctomonas sp. JC2975]
MARPRGHGRKRTALEVVDGIDLSDKEAIVTGGSSGLGLETARALAVAGARVEIAGRDVDAGEKAAAALRAETGNEQIVHRRLDLASLESVSTFIGRRAATGLPLHILVLNAGVMATPFGRTENGFETQFGVNHLGHFAFATGLLPALRSAGGARVVSVSSRAHRRSDVDFDDPNFVHTSYDPWLAYGRSKSANALFSVGFSARFQSERILSNAVSPGAVLTGLQRHMSAEQVEARGWNDPANPMMSTPSEGAATFVWAAVAPELDGVGGRYLEDCTFAEPFEGGSTGELPSGSYLPRALDPARAGRLWDLSERLLAAAATAE